MTSKLTVQIIYKDDYEEGYPLVGRFIDPEDGAIFSDEVRHRDLRAARGYYNGMLAGIELTGAAYPHRVMLLKQRQKWPYAEREFHVPVNMEYQIADDVPEELRN